MLLDGIRVIDWTVYQVGPFASAMLADLGADVIKVEHRERGDLLRGFSAFLGVSTMRSGRQMHFEEQNRNKRGIAIDMTKPKGVEVMYRLIERSDVLLTNYRPSAIKRFKLDYENVKKVNPNIIYASATGFGELGAEADLPSVDMLAQARSGAMFSAGEEGGPPVYSVPNMGDRATATSLAFATVAALLGRERQGIAQKVTVSQLGTMITLQGCWVMPVLLDGNAPRRSSSVDPADALYNMYQCQDANWVVISSMDRPGEWGSICTAVGRPELIADVRFATREERFAHASELARLLAEVFLCKPCDEWLAAFREHDILAQKINRFADLESDPQVVANQLIREWDHPIWGKVKVPGFLADFDETPAKLRMPAPDLGQHTEEVLTDLCGYSWDEVVAMGKEGVI